MTLYYAHQYVTTQLSVAGGISDTDTLNITLQDVTGIDTTKPGIALLDYQDPLDLTKAEWITYTTINGSKVFQGVTRGAEGSIARTHSDGCSIAFPVSKSHINNLNDLLNGTSSGATLTSPVLTTPQINDTTADHQYITSVSELTADRTVTLPLLTGNDEFVFKDHAQTLTNKTLTTPLINSAVNGFSTLGGYGSNMTIASGATISVTLNNYLYGFGFILDMTTGQSGMFNVYFGGIAIISQSATQFIIGSSPTTSQVGISSNGDHILYFKNGYAAQHVCRVFFIELQ